MQHTNAKRGADGRFHATDGPKAKAVLIYLQPAILERLDRYCATYRVGRGKAIGHLLLGALPPEEWMDPPTDTGPKGGGPVQPEPEPAPAPAPEPPPTDPEPPPTDTGREKEKPAQPASLEEVLRQAEEQECKRWRPLEAEAKALGIKSDDLAAFKRKHRLPRDQRLNAEAVAQLHQEQEAATRARKGRRIATDQHRSAVQQEATAERLRAIRAVVGSQRTLSWAASMSAGPVLRKSASRYLLDALPTVGIRQRQMLVKGVWADLDALVAVPPLPTDWLPVQRALFWGAVLRLPHLKGEPPTDTARFLEWCRFRVTASHRQAAQDRRADRVVDALLLGQMSELEARELLDIPADLPLGKAGINSVYRALARQHHPDAGGDAESFNRITEARDRLLVVAAD